MSNTYVPTRFIIYPLILAPRLRLDSWHGINIFVPSCSFLNSLIIGLGSGQVTIPNSFSSFRENPWSKEIPGSRTYKAGFFCKQPLDPDNMSAAAYVLFIPELLAMICDFADQSTRSRLTRVCRRTFLSLVPLVWKHVDGAQNLLTLIKFAVPIYDTESGSLVSIVCVVAACSLAQHN